MVNLRRLADRAKKIVERRGGTGALKEDAEELKHIAKGEGSLKDKAMAGADAVKEPGAPGEEQRTRPGAAGEQEKKPAE
jgi:hypothetical protein